MTASVKEKLPNKQILNAFGVIGLPTSLPGGQGTTLLVGDMVIKPVENTIEATFVADIMSDIKENGFRVARPIKSKEGSWIYSGWCAYELIKGEHVKARWEEKIEVCKAFHEELLNYPKPDLLDKRTNRYSIADKVAWQELPLEVNKKIEPALKELQKLIKPIDYKNQLIHGDFAGNTLFAKGLNPAVIDFSPYWRPADYAIAIMVADALVWEGADQSIFELVSDIPNIYQLIIRAEIGRIMQLDGLLKEKGIDKLNEVDAHMPLIKTLTQLVK